MPTLPFLREANPVQGLVFRRGAANLANDPHMYATNDVTPTAVYPDEPNGSMAINPAGTASTMLSFMVAGSRVYVPMAGGALSGTFDGIVGGTTPAAGTFTDLTSTGNTVLGNLATADTITATGRFNSDLVPSTNNARAFGTTALRWAAGWFDGLVTSGGGFSGVIGATGAAAGTFTTIGGTTITASTMFSGPHNGTVGATTPAAGSFTTLAASTGYNGVVGGVTPAAGAFTTLASSGATSLGGITRLAYQIVDMADAAHALVWSGAGAGETNVTGNIIICDPNSGGADEALTLPTAAGAVDAGRTALLWIMNSGGENITCNGVTIGPGKGAIFVSNGSGWATMLGA